MGVNPIILYQMRRALTSTEPSALSFADLPVPGDFAPMRWWEVVFIVAFLAAVFGIIVLVVK